MTYTPKQLSALYLKAAIKYAREWIESGMEEGLAIHRAAAGLDVSEEAVRAGVR